MKKVDTLCYKHFPELIPLFVLWRVKLSSSSNLPSWALFNGELWFQKYYISVQFAAAAKSLQSCPTLCDPIDGSPPGSAVPGILQARTLEWVAIAFSIVCKWKVKVKSLSCIRLVVTPWTAAYQAPPSMGFSRQEYTNRIPLGLQNCMYFWFEYFLCS